jgi:hypothetical protein
MDTILSQIHQGLLFTAYLRFCSPQCHHMSLMDFVDSAPGCGRSVTFEDGTPMRCSYVVPVRWMVIHEYEAPRGALNLCSTIPPRPWLPWESSPSRKNSHGRAGNRTRDLMISSQKLWPLDHEADPAYLNKICLNYDSVFERFSYHKFFGHFFSKYACCMSTPLLFSELPGLQFLNKVCCVVVLVIFRL